MSSKADKTNVMRILDSHGIAYDTYVYDSALVNAREVALTLGQDPAAVFKTLVTVGKSKAYYVFMIPAEKELDLKKAAKAAREKALEMIPQKELLPLTGYIHGGCSPIGMKKHFPTFIQESALAFEAICFSAGRVGQQVRLPPGQLLQVMAVTPADITKEGPGA